MTSFIMSLKIIIVCSLLFSVIYIILTVFETPSIKSPVKTFLQHTTFPDDNFKRKLKFFDPKIVIYNRVQKCGSRSILHAVRKVYKQFSWEKFQFLLLKFFINKERPTLIFNKVSYISNKLQFALTLANGL